MTCFQESALPPPDPDPGATCKRVKLNIHLAETWTQHVATTVTELQLIHNIEQHKKLEPRKTWTLVSAARLLDIPIPSNVVFPLLEYRGKLMAGLEMEFCRGLNLPSAVEVRGLTREQVYERFPGDRFIRIFPIPTTSAFVVKSPQEAKVWVDTIFQMEPRSRFIVTSLGAYIAVDSLLPNVASILRKFASTAPLTRTPFISFHKDAPFKEYMQAVPQWLLPDITGAAPVALIDVPYVGRDKIIAHLKQEILERFKNNQKHMVFSPVCHLMNASGYGKTKAVMELAAFDITVFMWSCGSGTNGSKLSESVKIIFGHLSVAATCNGTLQNVYYSICHTITLRCLFLCKQFEEGHVDLKKDGVSERKQFAVPYVPKTVFEVDTILNAHAQLRGLSLSDFIKEVLFAGIDFKHQAIWAPNTIFEELEAFKHEAHWPQLLEPIVSNWLRGRYRSSHNGLALIIVYDEAHNLIRAPDSGRAGYMRHVPMSIDIQVMHEGQVCALDTYRGFRSMARFHSFYWGHSISLMVSNVAYLDAFYPAIKSVSFYGVSTDAYTHNEPIVFNWSFDCFHSYANSLTRRLLLKHKLDWHTFLFGLSRVQSIISCGRPLFPVHLSVKLHCDLIGRLCCAYQKQHPEDNDGFCHWLDTHSLFDIAGDVTFGGQQEYSFSREHPFNFFDARPFMLAAKKMSTYTTPNCDSLNDVLALLGLAAGVAKFPSSIDTEELIRAHGMTCLRVSAKNRTVHGMFMSEGFLNGVAMLHMTDKANLTKLLSTFLEESLKKSESPVMSKDESCKVISRIMILTAMRRAKRTRVKAFMKIEMKDTDFRSGFGDEQPERSKNECIFEPVGIEDFLDALIGESERIDFLKSKPRLAGAMLAFNHFAYMALENINDPVEAAATFMARGAAVACDANADTVDFVLPLVLASNELSYFHWKVKCLDNDAVDPKAIINCSPAKAFGEVTLGADPTLRSPSFDYGYALHVFRPDKAPKRRATPTELFKTTTHNMSDGHACLVIEGNRIECMDNKESKATCAIIDWLHGRDYERFLDESNEKSHAWRNPLPVDGGEDIAGRLPVHPTQMRSFVLGSEYLDSHPGFSI